MMSLLNWLSERWFELVQTVILGGGLYYTAYTAHKDEKARKIANLIELAKQHQRIWKEFYAHPELSRVLTADADVTKSPISNAEGFFVNSVILQTSTVYRAMKDDMFVPIEGLKADVRSFFSLPIPRTIWNKSCALQNRDFAEFVDRCLKH